MNRKERRFKAKQERKNKSNLVFNPLIERAIYNNASTMIHEDKYVPMNCVLCGDLMKTIHDTHSPNPITELCYAKESYETGNPNRCCSSCNSKYVLPARLCGVSEGIDFITKGGCVNE
jgi:hypothetical protein